MNYRTLHHPAPGNNGCQGPPSVSAPDEVWSAVFTTALRLSGETLHLSVLLHPSLIRTAYAASTEDTHV